MWIARPIVRTLAALLLLAGAAIALADDFQVDLDPYRTAARHTALGVVIGRVYEERRKPDAPDRPLPDAQVLLVPRSEQLLTRLEEAKQQARDSMTNYVQAPAGIRRARDAYESELWRRGASDLLLATTSDRDGVFVLKDVPEGAWVLLAARTSDEVAKQPHVAQPSRRPMFEEQQRLVGYWKLTLWLQEVTITSGHASDVTLTDRNLWFSGVSEHRDFLPRGTHPLIR